MILFIDIQVLTGKFSHKNNIESRLKFLEFLNQYLGKKNEFNINHMKRLFLILVVQKFSNVEEELFLNWLCK